MTECNLYKGQWWGVERWEQPLLAGLKDAHLCAWSDEEAWERYPELRWVYDKQQLYQKAGETFATAANWPMEGLWVGKPAVNLDGMGAGAKLIDAKLQPPMDEVGVLQPYYDEPHLSTDMVFVGGHLLGQWTMQGGTTSRPGEFTLWKSVDLEPGINPCIDWARKLLPDNYTGAANVETRGPEGHLLELHLRPSLQFWDVSQGLLPALPAIIASEKQYKSNWAQTYSVPVFVEKGQAVSPKEVAFLPAGVSSVNIDTSLAQPIDCRRVAYVNGTDLSQCLRLAQLLVQD